MPRRVKIPEELEEPEEAISLTVEEAPLPSTDESPPDDQEDPPEPPAMSLPPPPETEAPVKVKKPLSEARLAALARAREKAKENARIRRLLKEGKDPNAPEPEPEPAPEPEPEPAKPKKTKKEVNDEKAEKVISQAKAKAKKIAGAPVKKAPKQTSVAEKTSKENARRIKEGEAMKKVEFEARVARQVQVEMKRQKAIERLEAEERENERNERNERSGPSQQPHQPQPQPQPRVVAPVRPPNSNVYEFLHEGEPAYVRMQKRGDSFIQRLIAQADLMKPQ